MADSSFKYYTPNLKGITGEVIMEVQALIDKSPQPGESRIGFKNFMDLHVKYSNVHSLADY